MATLTITILADAIRAKKALKETGDDVDKLGERTAGLGTVMGAGLAAGAAGLVALGVSAFNAAEESAKIGRETERVLRTTGAAAWESADQVGALAQALSDKTGVDDEAIQSGENLLLTFTNIRNEVGEGNDVFDRATGLALDMATALGTDVSGASIQLGKALQDPLKGITALSKAGVSFTQQQRDQIKVMVESGDVLGAQKIVLAELDREFKGAAETAGTPLDKLKVKIGNVQEALGSKLIPVVASAANFIGDNMGPAIEKATGFLSDHQEAVKLLASVGLTALAAAYAPVIAAQALLVGSTVIGWATSAAGYLSALGAVFLETAASEGVLAAATATLELTMLPVVAAVALVGGAVYGLVSVFDQSSESADSFFDGVMRDVDTSSFDSIAAGSQRVEDRMASLRKEIASSGWGDIAAAVVDVLVPFHDVENSLDDQESALTTLTARQEAHEAAVRKSAQALFDYATNSVLAAHGMDTNANSSLAWTDENRALNAEISATNEHLKAIAASKKIDLTSQDAVDRVQALYEKTQFATAGTLGMSDAQEKYNDAASTAKDKVDAYKSSLDALIGIHLSAAESETKLSQNALSTAKTLIDNAKAAAGATDVTTSSSLAQTVAINANNAAIQGNVSQILDHANAVFRETGSLDQASGALATNRQHLIDTMVQTGYTRQAAEEYIDRLGLTPANINTQVNLDHADAAGKLEWIDGQFVRVERGAHGEVTLNTGPAIQSLNELQRKIDDAYGHTEGGLSLRPPPGRATGGPVTRGQVYMVGERGPELFVTNRSGYIWPHPTAAQSTPTPVTTNINVNVTHTGLAANSPQVARDIVTALRAFTKLNGPVFA